ncbi:MAG: hypothetical protein ABW249_01605 [Solirubrobacterales bacterium]
MADSSPDPPTGGLEASSELRRSMGEATERIQETIDAAERVARQVRDDAESEAQAYLETRRGEADSMVRERSEALDALSRKLADAAESFRQEAERMMGEVDVVISEARAAAQAGGAPKPELRAVGSERPPITLADDAAESGDDADPTAEALLRATQMAVTGQGRDEIVAALRTDYPSVDAEAIADEILG